MEIKLQENKSAKGTVIFLHLVFTHYVIFQILSILRATTIYNTSYLANYTNLLISFSFIPLFIVRLKAIKVTITESILLLIPVIHFFFGIVVNGLNRNTFSDSYTSIFFATLIIYIRNQQLDFSKELQIKFANWMFWGFFISIITYIIFPLIGIKVFSVGATSVFFIFPLIVFFQSKMKFKFWIHLMMLIYASKRGVLISVVAIFSILALGHKKISRSVRWSILIIVLIVSIGTIYISLSPDNISRMPLQLQALFSKLMYVNPFSQYNRLGIDPRVREVRNAMEPLIEEPVFLVTGKGSGYTYKYYDPLGNLIDENKHNTHFSPVSIITRYGLIYTLILYGFIIKTIFKNFRKMRKKKLTLEKEILLLYVIGSFVNSFTAFTIYLDYLFIISLGLLNSRFYQEKNSENYMKFWYLPNIKI